MRKNKIGDIFMPHGLGHLIGINTHDIGGYIIGIDNEFIPTRLEDAKKLRTARKLLKNMAITIEPGC